MMLSWGCRCVNLLNAESAEYEISSNANAV